MTKSGVRGAYNGDETTFLIFTDVAPPAPVTLCVAARNAVPAGLLGAFVPECKEDGSYKEKQCHGSTGHCWCVDQSGKEIDGSKKGPGTGKVRCGGE